MFLMPIAVVSLLVWTIGMPIALFVFLRTHRIAIKHDQILRAHGLGDDRWTNPK